MLPENGVGFTMLCLAAGATSQALLLTIPCSEVYEEKLETRAMPLDGKKREIIEPTCGQIMQADSTHRGHRGGQ